MEFDSANHVGRGTVRRWRVLDSWVNDFTLSGIVERILRLAGDGGRRVIISNHNLNSLVLFELDADFRAFYSLCEYCFIDGFPVVFFAKWAGNPASMRNRVGVLDWIWQLFSGAAAGGLRITHLGSHHAVLAQAESSIRSVVPDVELVLIDGFFDMQDETASLRKLGEVRASAPDILLVGMGMPRQEKWLLKHDADLPECVIITVGGVLGYLGGDRRTAPRWIGRLGFEWLFRLLTEPRRLWQRYLLDPLRLIPVLLREARRR